MTPSVLQDDLHALDWSVLDHVGVATRLQERGWRFVAAGDWAVVLADPTRRFAARVSAFEPAFDRWVEICTRLATNPWVPRIELATALEGGGHLTLMELLVARDPATLDGTGPDPWWSEPPDAELAALKAEVERVDAECRRTVAWWGGIDVGPSHFMVAADGRPKLVDPLYVDGADLYAAAESDYAAFCAVLPLRQHRYFLQIPHLSRPEAREVLVRLRAATTATDVGPGQGWTRSVPSVTAVRTLVQQHYDLPVTGVTLVRSIVNDVYRVETGGGTYALKVYDAGRRSPEEVRWEQRLVRHLADAGLRVARDVPRRDGDPVGVLVAPEGERPYALTEWVAGEKPRPPWTAELYRSVGAALARLHDATEGFVTELPRRPVRSGRETTEVLAALVGDRVRGDLVARCAEAAERRLDDLGARGLRRGITHGDPSLDNLHVGAEGVGWYDFDLAGPGWPAQDLTGALSTELAEVFLTGYTDVRPLSAAEHEALPWLSVLARIENLHFHVVAKPARWGTDTLSEGWVDAGFDSLAATAAGLGLG